jgi:hypothetical protein
MKRVCFGCGKGIGDIDVDPTDDVKVWYEMHDGCESLMRYEADFRVYNDHVKRQSKLPKKGDTKPEGER